MNVFMEKLHLGRSEVRAALLIGLAAVLWFSNLSYESLWLDEAVSVQRVNFEYEQMLKIATRVGTNPPLHYVLLYGWVRVFGDSVFSVRAPSVLCALISLVFVYRLGRRLCNDWVAELALVLVVCSPFQFYYSQEARAYTLFAMLGLWSLSVFYQLLTTPRNRYFIVYVITTSLMLYSQPYGPFIIIVQNSTLVYLWIFKSGYCQLNWKHWFALQGVTLLIFFPWLLVMWQKVVKIQSHPVAISEPFWVDIPGVFKAHAGDSAVLGLGMILLAILGFLSCFRWFQTNEHWKKLWRPDLKKPSSHEIVFLVFWILIPILIPFFVSKVSSPIFKSRYTLIVMYAFFLLVAKGIYDLKYPLLRIGLVVVLVSGLFVSLSSAYFRVDREPWQEVSDHINVHALQGEPLVFCASYCQVPYDYYNTREDMRLYGLVLQGPERVVDSKAFEDLSKELQGQDRVWLILSHVKNADQAMSFFLSDFSLTETIEYTKIKVCLLTRSKK